MIEARTYVTYTDRASRVKMREYPGIVDRNTLYRRIALAGGHRVYYRHRYPNGRIVTYKISNGTPVPVSHEEFDTLTKQANPRWNCI